MKKLLYLFLFIPFTFLGQSIISVQQESYLELYQGWNMFGYSCYEPMDVALAFTSIEDKIVIVKDNSGNVYMPEFGFNGIGNLELNRGYQIKLTESISDFQFCPFLVPLVEGCVDETAFNYSSSANMDNGSCLPIIYGCLDDQYLEYWNYDVANYNIQLPTIAVNTDNGSCQTPIIYGCTNPYSQGELYNPLANVDDGSCILIGCADSMYVEYYTQGFIPSINEDIYNDLFCSVVAINGCMDETAFNYNPIANMDDGSCQFINCFYPPDTGLVSWLQENTFGVMNEDCLDIDAANSYALDSMNIWDTPITNLDGLQYFTNISYLRLDDNSELASIDLSGLSSLSELSIYDNNALTSINLSGLTNLSYLYFAWNSNLTSLPELSGLTNLSELYIYNNDNLECVIGGYPEQLTIEESWPPVCEEEVTYQVGDLAEGGIVFYVDETGTRGLVAAMEDIGQSNWLNSINAAELATLEGYDDWYLPSIEELELMYNTIGLDNSGNFLSDVYWSSTVNGDASAWFVDFNDGITYSNSQSNARWARPIRAFGYTLGCMDSLACNFNPEANMADGSCEYAEQGYDCDGGCPFQMMFNNDINTTSGITICSGDNTELSIQILGEEWYNYNNISWSDGSISANISIQIPSETTSYIINYQNDNINCIDSITVFVNSPEQGYDCDGNITAEIGDVIEGGYLFYLDEAGQHGLVAAMEDLTEGATIDSEGNPGYQWGCFATWLSGADEQAIGTGYQNTLDIVAGCSETPIAASEALAYESEDYSDWYLPSLDELNEMYNTIGTVGSEDNIGGFSSNWYWSSSESNNYGAYDFNFGDGSTGNFSSKTKIVRVRVIRSF